MGIINMKKIISVILSALGLLALVSCGKKVESANWGTTAYYRDFLFKKCPVDTLTKTLFVSFNEESSKMPEGGRDLVLSLYRVPETGAAYKVKPDEAQLYVDGKLSSDNKISVSPTGVAGEEQRIQIGVVLSKSFLDRIEGDCTVSYVLKVEKNPGYDRLNDLDISGNATPLLESSKDSWTPMTLYVNVVPNSLKQGVIWGAIILIAIAILWLFLSRCVIWTSPRFRRIYIDYHDGYGSASINVGGCYEVIFTDDPKMCDSVLDKIFKGKRLYVVNDFWAFGAIVIKSNGTKKISVDGARNYSISGDKERKSPFDIINGNGDKVTIETN